MKRLLVMLFFCGSLLVVPAYAAQADVDAEIQVQQEPAEQGFFSRSWANVKNFFAGDDAPDEEPSDSHAAVAEASTEAELKAEAETGDDGSLVDAAAEKTKAGVDWTADKAKKGAEWTKETAKDVTKATGKGIKKTGEAIEGLFPNENDTTVDAEAQVGAEVESD